MDKKIDVPFVVVKFSKSCSLSLIIELFLDQTAAVELCQNEKKTELVFCSDQPFELFNENHVFNSANLNKCSSNEIKNFIPPHVQEYLIEKFNLNDQDENMLYCDEPMINEYP